MTITIKSPKRGGKAEKQLAAELALPPEALRQVKQARHRGGAAIDSWVIHCLYLQHTVLRAHEVPRDPLTLGRLYAAAARRIAVPAAPPLRKTPAPDPHSPRHIPSD